MNRVLFFFLFTSFLGSALIAQNNGFMGKKNFISADFKIYTPILYMVSSWGSDMYKTEGANFTRTKNPIDYGFNFAYGRTLKRNLGLIFQYSRSTYDFIISGQTDGWSNYISVLDKNGNYITVSRSNWFTAKSSAFMPIIEFTNRGGLLPLGLSHQIGIGFSKHELVRKDYHAQYFGTVNGVNQLVTTSQIFDYRTEPTKFFNFMYKINTRIPISKHILYSFGVRYNFNLYRFWTIVPKNQGNYFLSNESMSSAMSWKEFTNFMSFETGFVFSF